ncbi:MAG: hypothetical protein QE263_10015 [Vampirovibrionales bacterium]|nr:hypothetical protein [Vampirovibrionales bacterium]
MAGGPLVASINEMMMQGRAYKGMPPELGGTSFPQQQNAGFDAGQSIFAQPAGLAFGNGLSSPSITDPLAFANGAGAFGVPYATGGINAGVDPRLLNQGLGNAGYYPPQGLYANQQSIGLPRQNTPTGYPPPVSGNKTDDIMFSVFQAVGIALKIRMGLNAQRQQQKELEAAQKHELEAALKQAQLDLLLKQGGALQHDMRSQWAEQDRLYAEEERRLGKPKPGSNDRDDNNDSASSVKSGALAHEACRVATQLNSRGKCAKGVRVALNNMGIDLAPVTSAYQMADNLAQRKDMKEVKYNDRKEGDIVVFDRTPAKPHGHVAIQLADGMQACDFVGNDANPNNYGGVRVFRLAAA